MTDHIYWKNGVLYLLDQRELPFRKTYVKCSTAGDVITAINNMTVRGAPLLGIVAAYGMVLGVKEVVAAKRSVRRADIDRIAKKLGATRPTAVNLFWALKRMAEAYEGHAGDRDIAEDMLGEALAIHVEDIENNRMLSLYGAELIEKGDTIMTHCNAGALATGGYGTALGVMRAAHEAGKKIKVIATETRPYMQGSRLTVWELMQEGIPVELVPENHAGLLCSRGAVNKIITGADRIAANGDTANKIGTYGLAVLARHHGIPFYVAAPVSTIDAALSSGGEIPIEERSPEEVLRLPGGSLLPEEYTVWNPAFDVTDSRYITAIITERGVLRPPYGEAIAALFEGEE